LQNHSNNYELSENAIKMTFCLISRHEGINNGCARRNGQVASTVMSLFATIFSPQS
jgi:hypothetical protein